jgi:hypothetical protein
MADDERSLVSKMVDIIKDLISKEEVPEEEVQDETSDSANEDESPPGDADEPETLEVESEEAEEGEETDSDTDEDSGGDETLVNAVKSLFGAVENWDDLPEAVQTNLEALAKASGEESSLKDAMEERVDKTDLEKKLEKSLGEQQVRLEKMEKQLADAKRQKRIMELEPISKSVGEFGPEKLYQLEELNPDLFKEVVKHMSNLQTRVETSEFFSERGTAAPIQKGSPTETLEKAVRDHMKEDNVDYATALAHVSSLPEYQDIIPELYRESNQGGA